jgi:hypothetical protein
MPLIDQATIYRDQVRQRLLDRNPSILIRDIAPVIGVTKEWLWLFAKGGIPDPSVRRIEALDKYLRTIEQR